MAARRLRWNALGNCRPLAAGPRSQFLEVRLPLQVPVEMKERQAPGGAENGSESTRTRRPRAVAALRATPRDGSARTTSECPRAAVGRSPRGRNPVFLGRILGAYWDSGEDRMTASRRAGIASGRLAGSRGGSRSARRRPHVRGHPRAVAALRAAPRDGGARTTLE
ncbi:hypothetical protein DENSPDRAFT_496303 [Dentipellis sp. KUC8613]|nr:hypothetical protein DENSPDRAFT_496303 [Dentipellis sp. KUC8613]